MKRCSCRTKKLQAPEGGGDQIADREQVNDFKVGDYIIYVNGEIFEIGLIKRIVNNGAFVWYSEGDTAAKTPFDKMHKLRNSYVIGETNLGGRMT